MKNRIIQLCKKYNEVINYIIVGVLTTLISLLSYFICVKTLFDPKNGLQLQIANIISWILSVLFAYVANRKYVFKSKEKNKFNEAFKFFLSRVSTLIIDMFCMFCFVTLLSINDKISKLFVQIIVFILNYIFSKKIVFRKNKKIGKVLFISSTGGHLNELLQLKSLFDIYDYHIVTEKDKSTLSLKEKYHDSINYLVYGTKDHILSYFFKFGFNCFKTIYLYFKIRPSVIITTGTHTAVPMCYFGKLFGSKIIFIETFANSETKTLSGKLVYPIADTFVVQWEGMLKLYPKAEYWGWIF